ncbi:GAP family protein [Cellulosimicrobium sp. NPDC057127]|uniref:GAP family protein n=1 Tax=Cellulosimicrobium sp. NPDC057127 TaxID=3346026 RepID=UPI0036403ADD
MGAAIGQSLPVAVGVLVSPLPIVAVVLMLVSGRARANATAFVVVWFVAVGALVLAVALLTGAAAPDDAGPPTWVGVVKLVLGVLLLLLALRKWQGRPREGAEPATPRWMAAIDAFTPARAAGLALLLGAVNPKNLLLAVSGGAAIGSAAPGDTTAAVVAALVFALVASLGVAAPVVVYLTTGPRAESLLAGLRTWMVRNDAVIMTVLLLVLGAKMIGDGLTAL